MDKQQDRENKPNIDEIADSAERGEDVSMHFTGKHVAKQRVNIDFPLHLLREIDAECKRIGVTRQAWIKMVCDDKLRQSSVGATPQLEPA